MNAEMAAGVRYFDSFDRIGRRRFVSNNHVAFGSSVGYEVVVGRLEEIRYCAGFEAFFWTARPGGKLGQSRCNLGWRAGREEA